MVAGLNSPIAEHHHSLVELGDLLILLFGGEGGLV